MQSPSPKKGFETGPPPGKKTPARSRRSIRTPFSKGSPSDLFPIVGVGASAGGLEAFTQLLRHLPGDTGLGFVLVQHLDPKHDSALTQLLARGASMPVREVTNNLRVERNHVYVIPPNTNLGIVRGVLKLLPVEQQRSPAHSIDAFFKSLAEDQRERAIGVVLSGTATDGTAGLEAIKAEGGITFAQDDSARYDSMPRSAVAAGCVDFVLKPEDIAKELTRIAKHPYVEGRPFEPVPPAGGPATTTQDGDDQIPLPSKQEGGAGSQARRSQDKGEMEENGFKKILLLLRNHSGVDFSLYKSTTIQRRITRRMVLNKQNTLEDYAAFIQGNAKELDALYSDVLISVTSFFRNPEAFEFLKRKIFPALIQQRSDEPVRIWVPGCSTGQEAYSIAMAFMESVANAPQMRKLQVFATDLNNALLDKARHGLYTKSLVEEVSPERLRRFFVEEQGGYRIIKSLREKVVFARQNLVNDPPFSRVDLISCRNLLIYLEPELQKKALPMFHYALKPGGALFLGASESIGNFTELFAPADKKHKIYFKKAAPTQAFHMADKKKSGRPSSRQKPSLPALQPPEEPLQGFRGELNAQREADRVMVSQFAPPAVLINDGLQILQFRGSTSAYLEPPTGKASFDVLKMAREGLMLPLRAAINKARKENKTACRENVTVKQNGSSRKVNVEVIPLKNLRERCFLILFEDSEKAGRAVPGASPQPPSHQPSRPLGKREASRIAGLESELSETRDYLQSIQEQHEAANEELQASNEEVQSANEELQSINEELETSKEELESANEELTTVNEEMASRNAELSRLNDELNNLHASVNLPILVLARDLTIRRFTAPAERIFNLLATDVGRPLNAVRHNLEFESRAASSQWGRHATPDGHNATQSLEALVREVIDTVSVREQEVRDKDGRWYVLRARPYLTLENKIDGAVVVLVDINELKRTERETKAAREYAEAVIRTARNPLVVLRSDFRVNTANRAFYEMLGLRANETEGRFIYDLGDRQWQLTELHPLLEGILSHGKSFDDFEVTRDFLQTGRRTLLFSARRLEQQDGSSPMILLAVEEVTERLRANAATAFLASIVNSSDDAIIGKDVNGLITSWNQGAKRLFGYTAEEAIGQPITMLLPPERQQEEHEILERLKRGQRVEHFETIRLRKDGSRVEISLTTSPIKDAAGQVIGASKIAHDITGRRRTEQDLAERARLLDLSNDAIIARGLDDKISLWNKGAEKLYGWTSKEATGQKLRALLQTEFPKPMEEILAELHREGKFSGEVTQIARDGRRIRSLCRWVLDPKTQSILTSYTDITEFKRVEEALRKSEGWQRLLLETVQDFAIFSTDERGRVTDWKPGAEKAFGYSTSEIIGQNFSILFTPEDRAAGAPEQEMRRTTNENCAVDERWHLRKDGGRFFASGAMRPLRDESGKLLGFLKVARDITERKQNEEILAEAKGVLADHAAELERLVAERTSELSATNKQLEAFVYSIAHDLRAPLRAMQGFSTLLVEDEGTSLSDTGKEYAGIISKSAQYMDALLRDLLAFSRISQQRVELTPVKLDSVVEAVLARLQKDIQESNALIESIGPWPPALAHEPTLAQVLFNLISNALKFAAPEVPPIVRLRTEAREDFIRVWVEDNGIGIEPDHQAQIFRLFTRLHGDRYEGTGIGLAIVQKGVERMRGQVGVESASGQGSRFWFELRRAEKFNHVA